MQGTASAEGANRLRFRYNPQNGSESGFASVLGGAQASKQEGGGLVIEAYESYSPLDSLGRCGAASACLGPETLSGEGERRAEIGHLQPTGWQLASYDQRLVPGESLYNRTHLIARCLCKGGDVPENLITGTQHLNQALMQPLENRVVDYIRQSGNHVLYRVTPLFESGELVARALRMEARSVEDDGAGISLSVRCLNAQPGVAIDYATGESQRAGADAQPSGGAPLTSGYLLCEPASDPAPAAHEPPLEAPAPYALNFGTQRFHRRTCAFAKGIDAGNKGLCRLDREMLLTLGYVPCGRCEP